MIHLESVDSTNDYAKRNCHRFDPGSTTLILADEQTGGKGRAGREWVSPNNGSLYLTFCTYSEQPKPNFAQLLALAAWRALSPAVSLKWPNDLLLNNKKVGGVLSEYCHPFAINGIGINLGQQGVEGSAFLPKTRDELLPSLHAEYLRLVSVYQTRGFAPLLEEYRAALIHEPGDPVAFHIGRQKITATFLSLTSDGAISLKMGDGTTAVFTSGDLH